jgi:hypothetical protein
VHVAPGILAGEFGPFANQIETNNTSNLKIAGYFFGPGPRGQKDGAGGGF